MNLDTYLDQRAGIVAGPGGVQDPIQALLAPEFEKLADSPVLDDLDPEDLLSELQDRGLVEKSGEKGVCRTGPRRSSRKPKRGRRRSAPPLEEGDGETWETEGKTAELCGLVQAHALQMWDQERWEGVVEHLIKQADEGEVRRGSLLWIPGLGLAGGWAGAAAAARKTAAIKQGISPAYVQRALASRIQGFRNMSPLVAGQARGTVLGVDLNPTRAQLRRMRDPLKPNPGAVLERPLRHLSGKQQRAAATYHAEIARRRRLVPNPYSDLGGL